MPIADASPQDPSGAPLRVPRRVWGAASWLIGGRLVSSSCTLLTLLALTGHLSDADFGRLTFWLAVFLVLDGVVDFGAGQISLQRAAADPAEAAPNLRTARRARTLSASMVALTVAGLAASFEAGGYTFACSSLDTMMLLTQQELSRMAPVQPGQKGPERLGRLASHLVRPQPKP